MRLSECRMDSAELRLLIDRATVRYAVSEWVLRNAHMDVFKEEASRDLILQMERLIAFKPGQTISVWATWWDAVKDRWFPAWAKARWPVQWKQYEARLYLPDVAIPYDRPFEIRVATFQETTHAKQKLRAKP